MCRLAAAEADMQLLKSVHLPVMEFVDTGTHTVYVLGRQAYKNEISQEIRACNGGTECCARRVAE